MVPADLAGERLDRALAHLAAGRTRSWCQERIVAGAVRVDGSTAERASAHVAEGARLEIDLPRDSLPPAALTGPEFRVVHEDPHVAVIEKPAGMLAHRSGSRRDASVAERAQLRWGPLPSLQGADRPGIAHRLDAGTTGLMVLGLTEPALADLVRQFRERKVTKRYVALILGDPRFDTQWIEAPIARSERHSDRMDVAPEGEGRAAETYYEVRERFGRAALVECRPTTGRTHQIRVHLASIGHPLLGDRTYRGPGGRRGVLPADAPGLERHALHAAGLSFDHPADGERRSFRSELPEDLERVLAWLRG